MDSYKKVKAAQTGYSGELTFRVTGPDGFNPISNATVSISLQGQSQDVIEQLNTDESGLTENVYLSAPPFEYSMEPGENQPYTEYEITVTAPGYEPAVVEGIEVLPDRLANQSVKLNPVSDEDAVPDNIFIPDHTLYGEYPPKIPEDEIKPMDESGEIVLSRVVIPEYIVVHDGVPSNSSATNYYVRYTDYIKNVASSEIYATWPESTIYANILCIMSVTLNRVYTEW